MTKQEATKIKNLIKNADSYQLMCDMIDSLVTDEPYWRTDTPTERGSYIVCQCGYYTQCIWDASKAKFAYWNYAHDCESFIPLSEVTAWHRIQPYKD